MTWADRELHGHKLLTELGALKSVCCCFGFHDPEF